MKVKRLVGLFARRNVFDRVEPRLAIGEGKPFGEQKRGVGAVRVHRPLQGIEAFKPVVGNAGKQRGQPRHFVHNLRGMFVVPVGSHAVGNELNDLPISLRFAERLHCFVKPLDAALGAGEGALPFERSGGREDEIGVAAGLGEVDILDDEEFEAAHAGCRDAGGAFAPLADRAKAGIFDQGVLRVGHLAVVFEEKTAAGAGDGVGARDTGDPVHDIERVLAQVGHLPARVIPEPAEVIDGAIRIVGPLRCRTQPQVVVQVRRRIAVRRIAEARRHVPKVAHLDRDQSSDSPAANQFARPLIMRTGPLLCADLYHPLVTPGHFDHPAAFADEQRQRLLHVHVLPSGAGHHGH